MPHLKPIARYLLIVSLSALTASAQPDANANLALQARATASSSSEDTRPENINDGDPAHTQWNQKDGTNPADTWVELDWPSAVQLQEVVIRQDGDPKLTAVELETRDRSGQWKTLQTIGDAQHLLTRLVLAQFPPQTVTALRLSHFAGNVSINEVEVYNRNDPPVVVLGSDLLNHIIGIVTDGFGTRPFADAQVHLVGTAGGKAWQASATTDRDGRFEVDMPVGLADVTATAQLANSDSAKGAMQAGDLTPGLSSPDNASAQITLDGKWRFKSDPPSNFADPNIPDADWKEINVPSHWMMEGFDTQHGVGAYRRRLQIPAGFRGRRLKLLFAGVYSGAEVYLNGKRVGGHEGGFAPFELDITDAANIGGDNLLAVLVREDTVSSHLDDMSHYANFPLAGIFRPVRLFSLPETHVRRFHVETLFDSDYKNATLNVDLSIENESGKTITSIPFVLSLKDPSGNAVPLANDRLEISLAPWSRLEKRLTFQITSPAHWEAEHPLLYSLSAKLSTSEGEEIVSRRIGFRQVEIHATQLLINGVPVKLRGTGYFEAAPLSGRVVAPDLLRRDLEMMKDVNLNAFRTEVILPIEQLYDLADEMGFYVEPEAPFCWVDDSSDLRYLPIFVQRTAEIMDRDRSHPSAIYWSVGNESSWGPDFEAAHQFVKAHDRTRPTSAGQSATLELDTMHNPISLARMKEREDVKVPIIWDESFCIFQGDLWGDTREMWLDPGDRDYYIAPLIDIWDAVQASKNVQGSMIWAWVDDIFLVPGRDSEYGRGSIGRPEHLLDGIYHMPGRGIVGDAPWGLVDGWRRKKPEFWHFKMLMSPVHLHERDLPQWKPGDPVKITVDNRYEFTNLSELTLEWAIGSEHGTLHPDIAPRSSGTLTIPLSNQTRLGDQLSLRFLDAKAQVIIPYRMQLGIPPAPLSAPPQNTGTLRYLHEGFWLGGPMERFIGDHFEIAFDGGNGRIRRALVDGHSVLYQTPKLHVLPIEATLNEFPIFETWRLTRPLEVRPSGDDYEIIETGAYRDFAGELRFRIAPDGGIRVNYAFTYTGTDTRAREIGLQFGVPLWCDKLQWRRVGEWSVYPADHIGRPDGVAMAHSAGPQPVPPTQPFALDDTPLGINDFRSTKRNFVFAALTDKDGYGIGIEAVGSQHLRASVDPDLIEVNVNDWFGGTGAVAWSEWWQNYGQGRDLRPDDPNEGAAHNKVSGSMQLHLLGPENSAAWLKQMQSISTVARNQQ